MQRLLVSYDRLVAALGSRVPEGLALLLARAALAGIFWRSGRTKVVEGTALTVSENARFLFEYEYTGLPLPPGFAAPLATYAEHFFPMLLVLGLFTRFAAVSLLAMTLVIQFFVYPEAWWSTHIVWVALAATLVSRGGGQFALDRILASRRARC